MKQYVSGEADASDLKLYEGWRNKYADEKERCREYEKRFAGGAGRGLSSWMDGRMVRRALEGVDRGGIVLDSPCGGGRIARAILAGKRRVAVADFSPWMVIESLPGTVGGARADALRLPFKDGAFAASVCFRFLHSVPVALKLAAIRELGRVSKVVLLNYLNALSSRNVKRFLLGQKPLANRVTELQAVAEVEAAGLKVEKCVYKSKFFFEDFVVVAKGSC